MIEIQSLLVGERHGLRLIRPRQRGDAHDVGMKDFGDCRIGDRPAMTSMASSAAKRSRKPSIGSSVVTSRAKG